MSHNNSYDTSHRSNASPRILTIRKDIKNCEEKKLEVTMSPGKLGFVVDAPLSGSPVAHAVKHTLVYFKSKDQNKG